MHVDLSSLHKILRDSTRRDILLHLSRNDPLTYVELMDFLKITNTGKFNYHLKILGDLIEKGEDGKYRLTEKGNTAVELLERFSEKNSEPIQPVSESTTTIPERSKRSSVRGGRKKLRYVAIALILAVVIATPLYTYAVANNVIAYALDEISVTTGGSHNTVITPSYVTCYTHFSVVSNATDAPLTLNINISLYVESIDHSVKYPIGSVIKNETVKGYTHIGIPYSFNVTSENALNVFHSGSYGRTWSAEITASGSYLFWHVTKQRTYP